MRSGAAIGTRTGSTAASPPEPIGSDALRWVALGSNAILLLAGGANLIFGNCCMGVIAVPLGVYNFIVLLGSSFDAMQRPVAIVVNILTVGAGIAAFALARVVQQTVSYQLVDLPAEFHTFVVINSYAVAGALVLAGATAGIAAALRPTE